MGIIQEIPCPADKFIRYFLWAGYFHDSNISNIEFNRYGTKSHKFPNRVELTIVSFKDMADDKSKPDNHDESLAYIQANQSKYVYKLIFEGCEYFGGEHLFVCNDYISGRFKDSALLRKIQADPSNGNKRLYHYRIRFDDGYMDLIFHKFRIQKLVGRAKCPSYEFTTDYPRFFLERFGQGRLTKSDGTLDVNAICEIAEHGDNVERAVSLNYLVVNEKMNVVETARRTMKLDGDVFDDARTAAIWVIGLQGDESDLPMLFNEYLGAEKKASEDNISLHSLLLDKRNILDAIEMIGHRTEALLT